MSRSPDAAINNSPKVPLRPLAPITSPNATSLRSRPSPLSTDISVRRKRQNITAACEPCRKRKSKCNGERPKCKTCLDRLTDCLYAALDAETHSQAIKRKFDELKAQRTAIEEIFDALQSRSQDEALEIFSRIRNRVDPETVLRFIKDGDLLLQLSLMPEIRYRYEFPHVLDMPAFLQRADNPYLDSLMYEKAFNNPDLHPQSELQPSHRPAMHQSQYVKPYHAAEIVESKLAGVSPSNWTSVSSDDGLLRKLLEAYFQYEYPTWSIFHKGYFLEDMASGRDRFCSCLLVNAILAEACHSFVGIAKRAEFWNPQNLGYQFLAEAKRLWEFEADQSRLTTVQAAVIMHITYSVDGLDRIGLVYLKQAVAMAQDLQLFTKPTESKSTRSQNAREFTAWYLFCYQLIQCFYFFRPPLIKEPPKWYLPDPIKYPDWYGELWIRYPLDRMPSNTYFGHTFKAFAQLHVIMNDIALQSFRIQESPKRLSMTQVIAFQQRLDTWFQALPEPLMPKNIVLPCHLSLHLQYHRILFSLFEQEFPIEAHSPSHSFTEDQRQEVLSRAEACFETLLRLYYLRHSFEKYDTLTFLFITTLGFSSLGNLTSSSDSAAAEASRSTLLLCAKGVHDQGAHYHVAKLVFKLLLTKMTAEDIGLLEKYVKLRNESQDHSITARYIRAQWPMPIIKLDGDPELVSLENMLKEYDEKSLEDGSSSSSESMQDAL